MNDPIIGNSNYSNGSLVPIDASGKSFVVKEWTGSGPEYLHVHYHDDEAWYIIEGTLTFKFKDNVVVRYAAGTTVFVPAGVPHTYYEENGQTRYLIIMTPRLNELINELHKTALVMHGGVLKKYQSEIVS